jgi:squalene-associated FAD-dependent desaturase
MTSGKAYVIGAGLSGLSAAISLADKGARVEIIEAAPQAGGRCRSYFDPSLGQVIDNGNHFVLSGNHATMAYLKTIGSEGMLQGSPRSGVPFVDIATGSRWALAPSEGPIPFWLFNDSRRVPDTRPADYFALFKLLAAGKDKRIRDVIPCSGPLWDRLLYPFFLGALNTEPEDASAALAAALVRETFAKGGRAYRIRIAHPTLAAAFVDPALAHLKTKGVHARFGARLRRIVFSSDHAMALECAEETIPLTPDDTVVLATPPWSTRELIPDVVAPDQFRSIVNAHFKRSGPPGAPLMLGVLGGTAQWIFSFTDRISITVSGADAIVDDDREVLAKTFWADVQKALAISDAMPQWQIVKEKRATFASTPAQAARRAGARTRWSNLMLAGDWTDTGLPATIEGALRSGRTAAELALKRLSV